MSRIQNKGSSGWVNRFWLALEYSDQKTLRHLLAHGANINHIFKQPGHRRHGQTPLCIAVSKNNRELVCMLTQWGSNLEHTNLYGDTPLFMAVYLGKAPMIRYLINAGSNIHHCNHKGENVQFLVVRLGRKDLFEMFLQARVSINLVNKDGATPLLLALELYENSCKLKHATRRSAPSNMCDIIRRLIPLCSTLNHHHPNWGTALRMALNIETVYFPYELQITKLLLQHGAIPDCLFFLRFGGLNALNSKPGAEFFTENFFNMAIQAGANLQREKTWLAAVLQDMPQELDPHGRLFRELLNKCLAPRSLQSLCQMSVRKLLIGKLWSKVDNLPLPLPLKDFLKLDL